MASYIELAEKLSTARNQDRGKPVANNTRLFRRDDEAIAVRLHDTDVCVFHLNGTVTLDSGGWRTLTTRDRINRFSPARVFTERGTWYIATGMKRWPFSDGVTVDDSGIPCDDTQPDDGTLQRKARHADKLIKRYVDGFAQQIRDHGLTDPSKGDCLYCQLYLRSGEGWGEVPRDDGHPHGDAGHLASHINENYYVPSLAWNSIVEAGYREPAVIWELCHNSTTYAVDTIKRTLRNYLRKRKADLTEVL